MDLSMMMKRKKQFTSTIMQYSIPPCFYRLSVKALILNEEGKIFLVQDELGNWELPWGGLEYGEKIEDCIRREILEETWMNVTIVPWEPEYCITCIFNGKNKVNIPIANIIYKVEVAYFCFEPKEECIDGKFFEYSEAKNLPQSNHTQAFLEKYNPKNHVHL